MTTMTMPINGRGTTSNVKPFVAASPAENSSNVAGPGFSAPEAQLYYWTYAWQKNEAAARADIAAGDLVSFENADDVLAWLDSDD